jgi:hypothetical protein
MSDDSKLIPPRTKRERQAYVAGYANAVNDIDESGFAKARTWLSLMRGCEPMARFLFGDAEMEEHKNEQS